jgi:hypothetical protein
MKTLGAKKLLIIETSLGFFVDGMAFRRDAAQCMIIGHDC